MTLLPPLNGLRCFEAAARLGSFKKAAAELNLSPSAISHAVDGLEANLGLKLFRRLPRAVELTAEGATYFAYVASALDAIRLGTTRIRDNGRQRPVRVSSAPSIAYSLLLPILEPMFRRHPKLQVRLDTSARLAELPLEGIDIALRRGRGQWQGVEAHHLFTEAVQPFASPDYIRRHTADGAFDWASARLIRVGSVAEDWDFWCTATGAPTVPAWSLETDSIDLAIEAARAGLGVVLDRHPLISEGERHRALRPVGPAAPTATGYWLVLPAGEEPRREVRLLRDWIKAAVAERLRQAEPPAAPATPPAGP